MTGGKFIVVSTDTQDEAANVPPTEMAIRYIVLMQVPLCTSLPTVMTTLSISQTWSRRMNLSRDFIVT